MATSLPRGIFTAGCHYLQSDHQQVALSKLYTAPQRKHVARFICRLPVAVAASASTTSGSTCPSSTEIQIRISVAASTRRLDINECGLKELPADVFMLTDLEDLSCSGNQISSLPDKFNRLRNLKKLGLSGNGLRELPPSIGCLQQLEGLWLHGNLLKTLPKEVGELHQLQRLLAAGNRLGALPDSLCGLTNLRILSVPGNEIRELPTQIGNLKALQVLAAYGNRISMVPDSLTTLSSLQDLWLQSNVLEDLPSGWDGLSSLKQLSLADNLLQALDESLGAVDMLEVIWLYGNKISKIPRSLRSLKKLSYIWMEGNPITSDTLMTTLPDLQQVKTIGVSSDMALPKNLPNNISISSIVGTGAARTCGGYFKLEPHSEPVTGSGKTNVLVVAFGSAPGVPNWGGLLKKVRASMRHNGRLPTFDILYVVDSARSWYTHDHSYHPSNEKRTLGSYYRSELKEAVTNYRRVIMVGDSMGASGALIFSELATDVLAFCPQVDLTTSAIRPGKSRNWLMSYTEELLNSVQSSAADIVVHCGSWSHDIEQARLLPPSKAITVKHNIDDHRVAKELDNRGQLVDIVETKVAEALIDSEQKICKSI